MALNFFINLFSTIDRYLESKLELSKFLGS